jgi:hypothetical protein
MNGCFLSVDLEDFSYNLQRSLGMENPVSRSLAMNLSIERIIRVIEEAPGSNNITFFSTGQVARDNKDIIKYLSDNGHEIGCHNYYHDNVNQSNRVDFSKALDDAIDIISQSSGKPVYGFRAPNFSIDLSDQWAFEEISKRFLYDSSLTSSVRECPNSTTELKIFGDNSLIEFPVFSYKFLSKINVRVIGGTFLKILPLKIIVQLMHKAVSEGFVPLIYIHPYEFLYDDEFWLSNKDLACIPLKKKIYWQVRQNQWLKMGNKGLIKKLSKILEIFPNQGTMVSHLDIKTDK